MNGKLVAFVTLAIALGIGAFAFLRGGNSETTETENTPFTTTVQTEEGQPSGQYLEYSPSVLEESAGTRRVLFFYASWCPTCRPADADFKQKSAQIPNDVTLIRVNYNDPETDKSEEALAEKYGVTYQHTYVQIDNEGNEIVKWNGGKMAELLANIQ